LAWESSIRRMPAIQPTAELTAAHAVPRFLVELPSRPRVFFGNLGALLTPRKPPLLSLDSPPGEFWRDVFVERSLPWRRFLESAVYHVMGGVLLVGLARLLAMQPRTVANPTFEHSQVIYYNALDALPPPRYRPAPFRAAPEGRSRILSPADYFGPSRSGQPWANRRQPAKDQAEARHCTAKHGRMGGRGAAAAGYSRCSLNARRRDQADAAGTECCGKPAAGCGPG